jgi:hypothetical protein
LPTSFPEAGGAAKAIFGIIRRLARVPSAKQQGIAIQFAILSGFGGNMLTAQFSAARKISRFDQFFRLI